MKVRHAVYIDDDRNEVLKQLAGRSCQAPGTIASALLSAVLSDPAIAAAALTGSVVVAAPGNAVTTPLSQEPAKGPLAVLGNAVAAPGNAVAALPSLDIFSSLTSSVPEKKKRKKTESPSEGADEFDRGWKGYAKVGGRTGSKPKAVESWNALLAETGWSPDEVVRRWAVFAKRTEKRFLPQAHRVLSPHNHMLTDEALEGLEVRRADQARKTPAGQGGPEEFAAAYDERIAERRRAADPIPRPSAHATRPALAGGPPAAPQAPAPVRP